ncbi:hypothetical protein ACHQM5_026851 [Ranunculus cassubicifolius]
MFSTKSITYFQQTWTSIRYVFSCTGEANVVSAKGKAQKREWMNQEESTRDKLMYKYKWEKRKLRGKAIDALRRTSAL